MATVGTTINKVRNRLKGDTPEVIDQVSGAPSAVATTITLTHTTPGIGGGSVLEVNTEEIYVISRAAAVCTVIRGWNSTTAASHANGDVIYVNPRWSAAELVELFAEEVRSWPIQLGRAVTVEVTMPAQDMQATLTPGAGRDITRLLDANLIANASDFHPRRRRIDVGLITDTDANQFTTSYGVKILEPFTEEETIQVDMLTSYDLSALTTLGTDLETGIGMSLRLEDIVIYGMLWRAMSTGEVARTSQASMRTANNEQVPPTHIMQAGEALRQIRQIRISEEITRVYGEWPMLKSTMEG